MRELIKSLSKLKLNYELGKKTWFGTGGSTTLFLEVHSKSKANNKKLLNYYHKFSNLYSWSRFKFNS